MSMPTEAVATGEPGMEASVPRSSSRRRARLGGTDIAAYSWGETYLTVSPLIALLEETTSPYGTVLAGVITETLVR